MSFTTKELESVGLAGPHWPEAWTAKPAFYAQGFVASQQEFCVRLAIEHPERAGEALGAGWVAISRAVFLWSLRGDLWDCRIAVDSKGIRYAKAEAVLEARIPPEFDAALQRARLVAAAWQRIEAKAKEVAGE